jgi:hypothetical protein
MLIIIATQEAEIRWIMVQGQQIVWETLSQKYPSQKRAGGVAQSEGSEFKLLHCKKKKKLVLKSWAGGVAQIVEPLPSNCKALSEGF